MGAEGAVSDPVVLEQLQALRERVDLLDSARGKAVDAGLKGVGGVVDDVCSDAQPLDQPGCFITGWGCLIG